MVTVTEGYLDVVAENMHEGSSCATIAAASSTAADQYSSYFLVELEATVRTVWRRGSTQAVAEGPRPELRAACASYR